MGRRLSTEVTSTDPLFKEMLEREPPVIDGEKLSDSDMYEILEVAETVGAGGPRVVELLGAPRDGGPVSPEHTLSVDQQPELIELLTEFMERIDSEVQTDRELRDLAYEPPSAWKTILDDEYHQYFRIYLKINGIRKLVTFAYEHDLELYIS